VADEDIELVKKAYAAFASGDIDAAVAAIADDVVWIEPDEFPNGGRHDGREAVRDYLQKSRAMWTELHSTVDVRRVGGRLVAIHSVSGTLADGTPRENSVGDVYVVRDGVVVAMTAYATPEEALASAGEPAHRPTRDA